MRLHSTQKTPVKQRPDRNLGKVVATILVVALLAMLALFAIVYLPSALPTGTQASSVGTSHSASTSVTPAKPANISLVVRTFGDLVGNYSQAALRFSTPREHGTASYLQSTPPAKNSARMYEASFSLSLGTSPAASANTSAVIWLSESGTPVEVDQGGTNYTGSEAILLGANFTSPFINWIADFDLLADNSTISSHFVLTGDTTATLGPTAMDVAIYDLHGSYVTNSSLTMLGATFQIGTPIGTGGGTEFPVVTAEALQTTSGLFSSDLISIDG